MQGNESFPLLRAGKTTPQVAHSVLGSPVLKNTDWRDYHEGPLNIGLENIRLKEGSYVQMTEGRVQINEESGSTLWYSEKG